MTVTTEPRLANDFWAQPSHRLHSDLLVDGPPESIGLVLDMVGHPMLICCLTSRDIIAVSRPACRLAAHQSQAWQGQSLRSWVEAVFGEEHTNELDRALSPGSAGARSPRRLTARDGRQFRWQWRTLGDPDNESLLAVLAFYECSGPTNQADLPHIFGQDELTGLPSRAALVHWVDENGGRCGDGSWCAAFFLDIDDFKAINDQFGHLAGDRVLRAVARRLSASLRPSDLVVRYGGDEFVAIVAGIETPHEADRIATRISAALAQPIDLRQRVGSSAEHETTLVAVGVSLGVSLAQGNLDFERLIDDADRSMYRAKARTRR